MNICHKYSSDAPPAEGNHTLVASKSLLTVKQFALQYGNIELAPGVPVWDFVKGKTGNCQGVGFVKGKEGERCTILVKSARSSRRHFAMMADVVGIPVEGQSYRHSSNKSWITITGVIQKNKSVWVRFAHCLDKEQDDSLPPASMRVPVRRLRVRTPTSTPIIVSTPLIENYGTTPSRTETTQPADSTENNPPASTENAVSTPPESTEDNPPDPTANTAPTATVSTPSASAASTATTAPGSTENNPPVSTANTVPTPPDSTANTVPTPLDSTENTGHTVSTPPTENDGHVADEGNFSLYVILNSPLRLTYTHSTSSLIHSTSS